MVETLLTFDVEVVDGEGLPVADIEVGARFTYPTAPTTWSVATSDGDGWARFRDSHQEPPEEVCLYVGDELCGTFTIVEGAHVTIEL